MSRGRSPEAELQTNSPPLSAPLPSNLHPTAAEHRSNCPDPSVSEIEALHLFSCLYGWLPVDSDDPV